MTSNDSSPGANLPMVDSNEYAQKRLGAIGTWLLLAGIVLFLIAVASTLVLASNILTLEHVFALLLRRTSSVKFQASGD